MMLKRVLLAATLLLCMVAGAQATQTGAFISVGGGQQWLSSGSDVAAETQVFQHGSYSFNAHSQSTSRNLFGRLGVGYGRLVHCHWYLATELAASLYRTHTVGSSLTEKQDPNIPLATYTYTDRLMLNNQVELSGTLGYAWPRWMTFARLGYVNAALDYSNTYDINNGYMSIHGMHSESSGRVSGALMGVGVRLPVSEHLDLSAEYDYTLYANVHRQLVSNEVPQPVGTRSHSTADVNINHLHSSNAVVSLIYMF